MNNVYIFELDNVNYKLTQNIKWGGGGTFIPYK